MSPFDKAQNRNSAPRGRALGTEGAPATGIGTNLRGRRLLVAVTLVVALVIAAYGFNGSRGPTTQLDLVTAMLGDVENVVTAAGNLQPLNFVDVGAQVSGQLKALHVEAGDNVEEGQLLAEIDATIQMSEVASDRARLQSLEAQLQDRQAQLELAVIQADRQERLMAENATSQEAYDSAMAERRSAQAQLKATQAEIEQSRSVLQGGEALLGYSNISAPIGGTISSIVAKQGQTLNANQQAPTILQIADLSVMTVSTQVSEADVSKLYVGMECYFTTLGGGARRWAGTLRQILPTPVVENNVVLYTALFDVDNAGRELMTQMTAQVYFVVAAAYDVVRLPIRAISYAAPGTSRQSGGAAKRDDEGGGVSVRRVPQLIVGSGGPRDAQRGRPAIVMVSADGQDPVMREIIVGVSDRINIEVISGLEEGEQVAFGAPSELAPRQGNNNNGGQRRFGNPLRGFR